MKNNCSSFVCNQEKWNKKNSLFSESFKNKFTQIKEKVKNKLAFLWIWKNTETSLENAFVQKSFIKTNIVDEKINDDRIINDWNKEPPAKKFLWNPTFVRITDNFVLLKNIQFPWSKNPMYHLYSDNWCKNLISRNTDWYFSQLQPNTKYYLKTSIEVWNEWTWKFDLKISNTSSFQTLSSEQEENEKLSYIVQKPSFYEITQNSVQIVNHITSINDIKNTFSTFDKNKIKWKVSDMKNVMYHLYSDSLCKNLVSRNSTWNFDNISVPIPNIMLKHRLRYGTKKLKNMI